MRLGFVLNLQAVLDCAQESVSIGKHLRVILGQQVQLLQSIECFQGVALLQERIPGAVDELKGLDDELNLANSAVAKLHVAMQIGLSHDIAFNPCLNRGDFLQNVRR